MDLLQQSIQRAKAARHAPIAVPSLAPSPKVVAISERDMETARKQISNLELKCREHANYIEQLEAYIAKLHTAGRFPMPGRAGARPEFSRILEAVAHFYGVSVNDIKGPWRHNIYVEPRRVAVWIARKRTLHGFPTIGKGMGGRDHTTVLYAFRRIEKQLDGNAELAERIAQIEIMLGLRESTVTP